MAVLAEAMGAPSEAKQQRQMAIATSAIKPPPPPPLSPTMAAPEVAQAGRGAGASAMAGTLLTGPRGLEEPASTARKQLTGQ